MDTLKSIMCTCVGIGVSLHELICNFSHCVHSNMIKSDLKIPSEHSICGKKFPAELSIYLLHPLRRQTVAMSILMDFDPSDSDNHHFQKVIDKWQQVFDVNNLKCTPPPMKQSREFFNAADIIGDLPSSTEAVLGTSNHSAHKKYEINNGTHRILNGSLARRDVWDPFHPEMERVSSIIF